MCPLKRNVSFHFMDTYLTFVIYSCFPLLGSSMCVYAIDVAVCAEELFELVRLSEVPLDYELFKVVSRNSPNKLCHSHVHVYVHCR